MIISKNRIVTSLTKVVLSHTLLSPMANANLGATFSMICYVSYFNLVFTYLVCSLIHIIRCQSTIIRGLETEFEIMLQSIHI